MDKQRKGYEWWDRICKLPKYSFVIGLQGGVRRVEDGGGKWIGYAAAQAIVDDAQAEINVLRERLERLAPAAAQPPSASDERDDEVTQPWYDLAWKHGALPGTSFAGDELDSVTFDPASFENFCAALAPSPGVDAAEQTRAVLRETQTLLIAMRHEIDTQIRDNRLALEAAPSPAASAEPHPPSRTCMCADCRPSFDNGADDPTRRYDITRGGANG